MNEPTDFDYISQNFSSLNKNSSRFKVLIKILVDW